jgi:hypothetical protein
MPILFKLCGFFLLVLFLPLQSWAFDYSAKAIEGWVVDAETRQPLEGVNVVANWVLIGGGGNMKLMETATDKNGRYYLPAWGPEPIPAGLPRQARLGSQDPELIFFKSGYAWNAVSNEIEELYPGYGAPVRTSQWNGKTIELKKFEGPLERYASFTNGVLSGVSYGHCRWKQIPKMLVTLDKEKARLKQKNVFSNLPTIQEIENLSVRDNCGSVQEFFRDYLK